MFDCAVGEKVGFARFGRFGGRAISSGFGTVTKVNGFGHIFVTTAGGRELRFDKYGDSYKDSYGPRLMCPARLTGILEAEENERIINTKARGIIEAVEKTRCGNGRIAISTETLDEIEALVAQLRERV